MGMRPTTSSSSPNWKHLGQWRRDQVTALVKTVYANAMEINPKVKITGALITWTPFSSNFTATAPYSSVYQDWHGWMNQHILDASIPMAYFRDTVSTQSTAYRGWTDFAVDSSYGRHAYIGPGIYLNDSPGSAAQIDFALNSAGPRGSISMIIK
jgi:uncharacterized lipoprotein YddW (UPF0748 family)